MAKQKTKKKNTNPNVDERNMGFEVGDKVKFLDPWLQDKEATISRFEHFENKSGEIIGSVAWVTKKTVWNGSPSSIDVPAALNEIQKI